MLESNYLTALDEPLLLMQGFKYQISSDILWKKGTDGNDYACDTGTVGEYLTWYKTSHLKPLGPSFSMTLGEFRKLFTQREAA